MDCDRKNEDDCGMDIGAIREILQQSIEKETELLRTYTMASERIHDYPACKKDCKILPKEMQSVAVN